jgi:hypothetical protein
MRYVRSMEKFRDAEKRKVVGRVKVRAGDWRFGSEIRHIRKASSKTSLNHPIKLSLHMRIMYCTLNFNSTSMTMLILQP